MIYDEICINNYILDTDVKSECVLKNDWGRYLH